MISILLPVWNGERYLGACLDSIRAQTAADWELIAVDDGSTDASARILGTAAAADSRIHFHPRPHQGLLETLRFAESHARGTHLARMDQDDLMMPTRLAHQRDMVEASTEPCVVTGRIVAFCEEGPVGPGFQRYVDWMNALATHEDHLAAAFLECPIASPSWMMRHDLFDACGGHGAVSIPEDYGLVMNWLAGLPDQNLSGEPRKGGDAPIKEAPLNRTVPAADAPATSSRDRRNHRAAEAAPPLVTRKPIVVRKVPETILKWRDHPHRATRTLGEYQDNRFWSLKATSLRKVLMHQCHGKTFAVWGMGDTGKGLARALVQAGERPECLITDNARKQGIRWEGIPVMAPGFLEKEKHYVLAAVSARGGWEEIAAFLKARGFAEVEDFIRMG